MRVIDISGPQFIRQRQVIRRYFWGIYRVAGHMKIVDILIKEGAEVTATTKDGNNVLHYVAKLDWNETISGNENSIYIGNVTRTVTKIYIEKARCECSQSK
jgi:hypothetical protein